MRIAHFSDLHVLSLEGVGFGRYLNKRFTGIANLALRRAPIEDLSGLARATAERVPGEWRRKDVHRATYVRAVAREVARVRVDHVAITGDLTNLSLQSEFSAARDILEGELHLTPRDVSIVPGNHDVYTRGALRGRRFTEFFEPYTHGDIDVGVDVGPGHFPYVKLRGPCAVIGLSSAVPRLPFVAAGEIGVPQLEALARTLEHPEVRRRLPVILVHHPPERPSGFVKAVMESLRDGARFYERLRGLRRGLVLHGHLHRRKQHRLVTDTGSVLVAGAASASLHHEQTTRMSGFNVYEIDDSGEITGVEAHVLDPASGRFHKEPVPEGRWE
jgi:3',5'-cyclic AMP phosphodiesterase CpdA